MKIITIRGKLSYQDIKLILQSPMTLRLAAACKSAIKKSLATVQRQLQHHHTIYGINTGFGKLADKKIEQQDLIQLQRNLVLSHACGTGELLSDDLVRLIMTLKINSLARGYSGVRLVLVDALIALQNAHVYPCIPRQGSVGASGDLAPLAHLALPLLGEGFVHYHQQQITARQGLAKAGLPTDFSLAPKEGLALLNGMQVSTAVALKALLLAEQLFATAIIAGALSLEATGGRAEPFDDRIHVVRGHATQRQCAHYYRQLLKGSQLRAVASKVQDPYSIRCQPQVMGACLWQMEQVKAVLLTEANAVSDNPLVFAAQGDILSGGNFHGEIVAMAADNLALAISEIGALSERRIALLMDGHLSGLPEFLVKHSGLNSGFMVAHVTAAALASDNKALAHPHCIDSLPTSANQEDHVSMAMNGAWRLLAMLDNLAGILAIELLAACQGLEFRLPLKTSLPLQKIYKLLRSKVPAYDKDRYFAPDIAAVKQMVLTGAFA